MPSTNASQRTAVRDIVTGAHGQASLRKPRQNNYSSLIVLAPFAALRGAADARGRERMAFPCAPTASCQQQATCRGCNHRCCRDKLSFSVFFSRTHRVVYTPKIPTRTCAEMLMRQSSPNGCAESRVHFWWHGYGEVISISASPPPALPPSRPPSPPLTCVIYRRILGTITHSAGALHYLWAPWDGQDQHRHRGYSSARQAQTGVQDLGETAVCGSR